MSYSSAKDTLRFRLSAYIALAILVTGGIAGAGFLHLLKRDRSAVLSDHLSWMATGVSFLVADEFKEGQLEEVTEIVDSFERAERLQYEGMPFENMEYLEVMGAEGEVLASARAGLDEEEIAYVEGLRPAAASIQEAYYWEHAFDEECNLIGVVYPILSDGERIGTVNVAVCDKSVRHAVAGYARVGGLFLLMSGLLGLVFGGRLALWVSRPIRNLAEGAERLSRGELGYRVDSSGPAEVRSLANSFNSMAANLELSVRELVEAREEALSLSDKLTESYESVKRSAGNLEEAHREAVGMAAELEGLNIALASEKKRTDTIVRSIKDGIIAIDTAENVILMNPAAEELFNISERDAAGLPVETLVERLANRMEDPRLFQDAFARSVADPGTESDLSITVVSPSRKVFKRRSSAIRDENGRLLGRVVTFSDITREQEIDSMKTNFVSTVSHELRTPLTSIKGALTLLSDGQVADDETRQEFLQIAEYNADRLINLISNLLDLSRMDSGTVSLNLSRVDISKLVSGFIEKTPFMAGRDDIRLVVEYPDSPVQVLGDKDKLEQVLANLLSNASKFSPKEGLVILKVYSTSEDVYISVEDEGPGIPPDKLERVFDRFYQVDMSATRRYGGTGLGLSICRAIAREHGGDVRAESPGASGRGARLTLRMPRVRQTTLDLGMDGRDDGGSAAGVNKSKVLVADSDPEALKAHRQALEAEGFVVLEASDGNRALDLVRTNRPGLVFMDVNLPVVSGHEVAEALKADEATAGIPIIFTSDADGEAVSDKVVRSCGYIPKPFGEDKLVSKVRECLGQG